MNRLTLTASLLVTLAACPLLAAPVSPPSAALPADIPANHFAAGAVQRVEHEKIMGRDVDGRFRGGKPVTRYELAVILDRFVRYMEAARKPLHVQAFPAVLPAAKVPPAARQAMQHLAVNGFLPPNSPLLTKNGREPVTAQELTDVLAYVTLRLSDRAEAPYKN